MSNIKIEDHAEEKKEKTIRVTLASQFGELDFQIKETTQLIKIMDYFTKENDLEKGSVRFMYDSKRIEPQDTCESLGIENEDVIDAMIEQTGG